MDKLYWLDQIQPSDRSMVGEKAFHLSRAVQLGYPVMPGFVVSSQVLQQFLETLNNSEPLVADLPHSSLHLNVDNPRQLQRVAQRLRQEITTARLPPEWVETLSEAAGHYSTPALIFRLSLVLPSATHRDIKTSGLLEAQVCTCDQEAMALALKRTWSQMFRARSLLYWQRVGIGLQQINLAVLVQPLTNAIASGSLKCNAPELEIQASWGLGMAISRGEVLPDSYFVELESGAVRSQQMGNKTLAYGLVDSLKLKPLLPQPPGNYLQTYLLSEAQQQQYALKDKYLQQLIQLAQRLSTELNSAFALEWTLSESEDSVAPQLYLTQVSTIDSEVLYGHTTVRPYNSGLWAPNSPSTQHKIRGLAAAVGRVVAPAHVIANPSQKPESLPPGVILVAPAIAPDWLPLLQQAAGVVTEHGGLTSHSAILARELGIPAVVSVAKATQLIQTGESVMLDGDRGEIYRVVDGRGGNNDVKRMQDENEFRFHPSALELLRGTGISSGEGNPHGERGTSSPLEYSVQHSPFSLHTESAFMTPGHRIATQLLVNLSQPTLIERVRGLPVDGVGLLRSELMALTVLEGQHPNTWLQQGREAELIDLWQEQISQFARAFAPRPVFYRSLDWRSHEFQFLTDGSLSKEAKQDMPETNPMLGQRGTFSYVRNPKLFDLELAALAAVQQSGYTNLHLLLPFVRTVEEFSFCRRRVEQAGLTQLAQFQLWIMVEVPSSLLLLPQYVKAGVQGVSIGTNDLTQLLLGVDRDQGQLYAAFDERHPVVMQAIAQIIQMAKQANIPCSICGQAPALYPELIDSLVRWGITSISVEVDALERTYNAIARAEQRLILEAARRQLGQ